VIAIHCTDAVVQKDLTKYGLPDGTTAVVNLSGENLMNPTKRQVLSHCICYNCITAKPSTAISVSCIIGIA